MATPSVMEAMTLQLAAGGQAFRYGVPSHQPCEKSLAKEQHEGLTIPPGQRAERAVIREGAVGSEDVEVRMISVNAATAGNSAT